MTNRNMKGLFKGLRYIGQIFDEENKDNEIHIGLPTDVKHVAHIGFDGPSQAAADSNPSWMRGFNSNHGFQPEPLDSNGNNTDNQDTKCFSEESKKDKRGKDKSGAPKSSRRRNLSDTSNNNSNESSTKPRHRRHNSKDSSECSGINSGQHSEGEKKMRRKKHSSKDSEGGMSSKSRSKHVTSSDVSDSGAGSPSS